MPEHRPGTSESSPALLFTCEHAGNAVPRAYRPLFARAAFDLRSHRGWDPGALPLAESLARALGAPLIASTATRLLVDLNRSLDSDSAFSRYTTPLSFRELAAIVREHYLPHRSAVTEFVTHAVAAGATPVTHIGVHSFTPVLRGRRRDVHVGLLFDPARPLEARFCRIWQQELARLRPRWTIALNRPYKGSDDGLTTTLRSVFRPRDYLGIELEVRQPLLTATGPARRRVHESLTRSLAATFARCSKSEPRAGR